MAVINIDVVLTVYRTDDQLPLVGFDSPFASTPVPATGNKIVGWLWDQRRWPTDLETKAEYFAPSIWDPDNTLVPADRFQSGHGDGDDLKIEELEVTNSDNSHPWTPVVNHGAYFIENEDFYFFSDGCTSQYFSSSGLRNGCQFLVPNYTLKMGIPVEATTWVWDAANARYNKYLEFTKRRDFTGIAVSGVEQPTRYPDDSLAFQNINNEYPEFIIIPSGVYLNGNYIYQHGVAPTSSGVLPLMEIAGVSQGLNNEQYNFLYSPVVNSGVSIVSFYPTSGTWNTWTPVNTITASGQAAVDYDLGVITFGTGVGFHPWAGQYVGLNYLSTVELQYEIENTTDSIVAIETNVDPLNVVEAAGFLILENELVEPGEITLTTTAPNEGEGTFGPVYLGSTVELEATVTTVNGQNIEGAVVTFNVLSGIGGLSGGSDTIQALTDFEGTAVTPFIPPRLINQLGSLSSSLSYFGGNTLVTIPTISVVGNPTEWYIYQVWSDDPTVGITSASAYYTQFFSQEDISGPTATQSWEQNHRIITELLTPTIYNAVLRNGRKQLMITWDATISYNPHTLQLGAYVPLRPLSAIQSGSNTIVTIPGTLTMPSGNLQGYLIVGPAITQVQASVYNERTQMTLYSNVVNLQVTVPPSMDGTVIIQDLTAAEYSALFANVMNPPTNGILPLGFRFQSSGVTLASALSGLSYFDINRPTNVIGHAFTVE